VGRLLILLGIGLIVAGAVIEVTGHLPGGPGRLPGDIVIRGKNSVFYFPVVTCLLLSALFSLVIWLVNRLR
jgi:hypothetical protein